MHLAPWPLRQKRTYRVLIRPDISCATDNKRGARLLGFWPGRIIPTKAAVKTTRVHQSQDSSAWIELLAAQFRRSHSSDTA